MNTTPKKWVTPLVLTIIIVALAAISIGILLFLKNQPIQRRGVEPLQVIQSMEPDSEEWGVNFPNQYSTLMMTKENNIRTQYGGSEPFSKLAADPYLVDLFAGYGFSLEYNEERGHMWALEDVQSSDRINEKTPGTCYSCKSSSNPRLWAELGMEAYDKMTFSELTPRVEYPIGCANCHEAGTMRLIVTNPALEQALLAQGKDWKNFTRQEMRTVVCANCHVEYYFKGDGKYLTFPWEKGTSIEQIEAYYNEYGFKDWEHPDSKAAMLKMQHPEFELYTNGSTHFNAGVSCADCHMPYTRDGAIKFTSHDVYSPLLKPEKACATCHTNVDYVVERVKIIQNSVNSTLLNTEKAITEAITAIKTADANPSHDPVKLDEARQLHRAAQVRWDFIAAENSMGFHNPEESLRILAAATDLARQAQLKAQESLTVTASK
jgi:nitrite reductase (cytochrome c-552)